MTKKIETVAIAAIIKLADLVRSNPEKLWPLYNSWFHMRVASQPINASSLPMGFGQWVEMVSKLTENLCASMVRDDAHTKRFNYVELSNMRVHVEVLGEGSKEYPWEAECRPMIVPHSLFI